MSGSKLSLGEFKERLRVLREENPEHWAASFNLGEVGEVGDRRLGEVGEPLPYLPRAALLPCTGDAQCAC